MSNQPTVSELKELEKLRKKGRNRFYFILLYILFGVVTGGLASISLLLFVLLFPLGTAVYLWFFVKLDLHRFRFCPRCAYRVKSLSYSCGSCGLDLQVMPHRKTNGREWYN